MDPQPRTVAESVVVDLKTATDRVGDPPQVVMVGTHHEVPATQRTIDDAGIDHIGCRCLGRERARGSGTCIMETLDIATSQQSGQLSLAPGSSPGLCNHSCRSSRHFSVHEQGAVASPHPAFALVSCD